MNINKLTSTHKPTDEAIRQVKLIEEQLLPKSGQEINTEVFKAWNHIKTVYYSDNLEPIDEG